MVFLLYVLLKWLKNFVILSLYYDERYELPGCYYGSEFGSTCDKSDSACFICLYTQSVTIMCLSNEWSFSCFQYMIVKTNEDSGWVLKYYGIDYVVSWFIEYIWLVMVSAYDLCISATLFVYYYLLSYM